MRATCKRGPSELERLPNPTTRSWWAYNQARIPPTAVDGLFSHPNLQTKTLACFLESHPRQWVDCSGTTYRRRRSPASSNPTYCSGWIVQAQTTDEDARLLPRIPPTAVGGLFRHNLQTKTLACFLESQPLRWVDCSSPAYSRQSPFYSRIRCVPVIQTALQAFRL